MPKTGFMKFSKKNYVKVRGTTDIFPKSRFEAVGAHNILPANDRTMSGQDISLPPFIFAGFSSGFSIDV